MWHTSRSSFTQDIFYEGKIEETGKQPKTWPDGCLGLAKPGEFCTQALVQGWRIILTDNQKTWVYRTDSSGANLRLEK